MNIMGRRNEEGGGEFWVLKNNIAMAVQLTDELWCGSKCYIKHDFQFVKSEQGTTAV